VGLKSITRQQSQDTGMAMVLLLLIGALSWKRDGLVVAAVIVLVADMTAPQLFAPLAVVWFGLSHVIGSVMSKVLLSVVYVVVVTPVGIVRRLIGSDTLRLRAFKQGDASVLTVRNHRFAARDLEQPY
jgi:hypothetical protein